MTTVYRGHVFTGTAEAEAVALRDGLVLAVGSSDDVLAAAGARAEIIDVDGLVVPGFVDSHVHLHMHGEAALRADLVRCTSWLDIRDALAEWAAAHPDEPRVLGRSWLHEMLGGQRPTREMLDEVVPDRPCYLDAADYHSVWCNSAALDELGIGDNTPDPAGGRIHRDARGRATGLVDETVVTTMVWPFLARARSDADRDRHLRRAVSDLHAAGVTSVVDMAVTDDAWQSFQRVAAAGGPRLRIGAHWLIDATAAVEQRLAQVQHAARMRHDGAPGALHTRGIKIIADGVIDGCTAALSEPYVTGEHPGPIWSLEDLVPVISAAQAGGLAVAVHAIGDAAVAQVLDAFEQVLGSDPEPHRHRIEHLEYTTPDAAGRCAQLGVMVSMQPVHSDPFILPTWRAVLGAERAARGFAWPEYVAAGARLAFGTDTPTAPHHALKNLWIATTRRSAFEPSLEPNRADFALPVPQALRHATHDAAFACGVDAEVGTLAAGLAADLVVLDRDPLREGPEALLQGSVLRTVVGAEVVHDRL